MSGEQRIRYLDDPELYCDANYVRTYGASGINYWSELCGKLVREAELKPEHVVADLGCGTGYATKEIVSTGVLAVYAIDPSKEMLAGCGGNLANTTIIQGTIDDLIKSNLKKPDVIISSGVFAVMCNPADVLKKIYSYLDKTGRYVFTLEDWSGENVGGESLSSFFAKVRQYEQVLGLEQPDLRFIGRNKYFSEEVGKMVVGAGGEITKCYSREMSSSAENEFGYAFEMSCVNSKIKQFEAQLQNERKLGVHDRLRIVKELREQERIRKLFEEFKSLYERKRWVVGTQHVFHTAKRVMTETQSLV
ncbi:MAG: class I SAM-dependent methyltransferase [Candidatus Woesearchaeota archaeon]|nr:class I SAM-dependent methyltransferase [Candidatus Woesearchaeota archaeon]